MAKLYEAVLRAPCNGKAKHRLVGEWQSEALAKQKLVTLCHGDVIDWAAR